MTFKVELTGFKTKAQAEAFVSWYGGAGEQDAPIWFENCADLDGVTFMGTTGPQEWKGDTLTQKLEMHGDEEE